MNTRNIEDIYKQTALQQGMLFHTLYDPEAAVYFEQNQQRLQNLDVTSYKEAWQQVLQRHTALRTAFHWEDLEEPLQVVYRQVQMPIEELDWRHLDAATQRQQMQDLCQKDRQRGFDLTTAPAMRLILVRLSDTTYHQIWDSHHMVLDGLSAFLVTQEVMQIYTALQEKRPLHLPQTRPFRDYVQWLNQVDLSQAENYWRTQLAPFTHPTLLTVDQNPTAVDQPHTSYGQQSQDLPPLFISHMQQTLRHYHLTSNTLFQAAWGLLLSVYSGENQVLFGQTNHGRPVELSGFANMVGLFITTTPVAVLVPAQMTVVAWMQQLQEQALVQHRYEHTPLTQIQSWSAIPRGQNLFHSLLLVQSNSNFTAASKEESTRYEKTNYAIMVSVNTNEKDYLRLQLNYNRERFSDTTITQLLAHFYHLIQVLCAQPEQFVSQLPLLPAAERIQLLQTWNQTEITFDLSRTVPDWLHEQAEKTPTATAVSFHDEALSYQELDARSSQLARYLQQLGVTPATGVGICLERSLDMVVSLLAVQKAGAAYIPIDPTYPPERINYMLTDSGAALLLSQTTLQDLFPTTTVQVIYLDAIRDTVAQQTDSFFSTAQPDYLAYLIYTSGSTGKPKGVQIHHRALSNFLLSMQQRLQLTPADHLLAVTTISFDIAGLELYLPLLVGAHIHLADRDMAADGVALTTALSEITIMQATPATWRMLLAAGWQGSPQLTILCGGEALPRALAQQLVSCGKQVWNMYGPTETTIWSTMQAVNPDDLSAQTVGDVVTIGRPIANTQAFIVDKYLRPLPVGVPGELLIGGAGLAAGYFQRPELTAERFLDLQIILDEAQSVTQRVYRTGDLATYLPNADIAFYGRIDHQVKIRGYRIELGEVEHQLLQHEAVRAAIVTAQPDVSGESRLVAYVISTDGNTLDTHDLRGFLQTTLPDYMLPSRFVTLEAFPLTPNGKVDRQALPTVKTTTAPTTQIYAPPRNETETQLVMLWQNVLNVPQVGIHDNFFELGGHSLLATRLISQVQSQFRIAVPIRRFFENPTIAAFATVLTGSNSESAQPHVPITPVSRDGRLPLSFSQMRLWFLEKLGIGGTSGITIPLAVRLQGQLDVDALTHSIHEVVRRHESLRTQFAEERGKPYQVILPTVDIRLPLVDISMTPAAAQEAAARERIVAEMKRPFSLTQPPLLRALLLKLNDSEHILCINMHHIISDGWSVGVLAQEIATIYQAFVQDQPVPLPELPIQYADFAVWQQQLLQGESLQTYLDYWRPHWLTPPSPLALPTESSTNSGQFSNGTERLTIPANVLKELHTLGQQTGASLYMVLLASLNALLYRYTQQTDISVGTYIANRNYQELEPLIGFFLNILVFRIDLSDNPTFRDLLAQARDVTLGAYAHQDIPYEKLLREFQPDRNIGQAMPFQVLLMLQNMPIPTLQMPKLTMHPLDLTGVNAFANYDLTFVLTETGDKLQGFIEYNAQKFDAQVMRHLRQNFEHLLAVIGHVPDTAVSALPLLLPQQEAWLLDEVNQTEADYPQRPLHILLAEQANHTPYATAIIAEDRQVTYSELDQRANQLAQRLHQLGVRPGNCVGIALNRTSEMIIALLGTLKAGGAYVPLDPNYPEQRLQYMMNDAGIAVLITEQELVPYLPALPAGIISLLVDDPILDQQSTAPPDITVDMQHLAYIIYTSGSTGTPKGVQVPHQALVQYTSAAVNHFRITPSDRVLQFASISFDAAPEEIYPCLLCGATLVLRNEKMLRSAAAFMEACTQYGITLLDLPTAYWHTLVAALEQEALSIPPALRLVILGGERAWPERLAVWKQLAPAHVEIVNTYGPTETTIVATLCSLTGENAPASAAEAPIGRPVANTQVYVLDRQMHPVPWGAMGELYIGGDDVARGYHSRPALTAERFVPNPFRQAEARSGKQTSSSRLYRTGDLVRYTGDGQLLFVGRADAQVKLRGFRIELDEISTKLRKLEGVETAVVILREDAPGDKRLVAYVVSTGGEAQINGWRQQLRQTLPDYMLPAHYVILDTLPLTPSGKVDQQALPAPDITARPELERAYEAPQTLAEEMLADLFTEITGVEKVGIYDNFFELGGHSLLATQLVARISEAFEMEFPLRTFFEAPTIAQLAVAVEEALIARLEDLSEDEVGTLLE